MTSSHLLAEIAEAKAAYQFKKELIAERFETLEVNVFFSDKSNAEKMALLRAIHALRPVILNSIKRKWAYAVIRARLQRNENE